MKAFGIFCASVIGLLVFGLFIYAGMYNSLAGGKQGVEEARSNIGVNEQRRADLVPNLVEVVKGYAAHEKDVFTGVAEARSKVGQVDLSKVNVGDVAEMEKLKEASGAMQSALSKLMVVVEKYPELKADQGFRDLQNQLEGTETRIAVARKRYNEAVKSYNGSVVNFPTSFIASSGGFTKEPYYESAPGTEKAPTVSFK